MSLLCQEVPQVKAKKYFECELTHQSLLVGAMVSWAAECKTVEIYCCQAILCTQSSGTISMLNISMSNLVRIRAG